MKNIFFSLAFLLLISCNPNGSDKKSENKNDTTIIPTDTLAGITDADTIPGLTGNDNDANAPDNDPINFIRKKVERINTIKLEKKHMEFMCDEKMMVDRYYEDGKLLKVSVDFGTVGDVYAKEDYYYDEGQLIFVYEFVEGGPACEGCIKKNEYRSYIRNDKVIRYLKDKTKEKCRTCEFGPKSKEYKLLKATTDAEIQKILCR